ncbi:CHAT domain-containing protein [Nostoc sp. UCD121]|uniref:CHAT domain-containing protein n=1 Tax=unclassified Nostoc TaxID=2593658 RepID=UPI001626F339|nr:MULTISPECIES: CHAT domain-containing protein [unclassified Nostoc]MBC1225201.1 CHAT domain-containing protein [Nostoc sp. UCD120]MBC1280272.1 CHAT domain-containing protein [Nostoc sp. UCD121]
MATWDECEQFDDLEIRIFGISTERYCAEFQMPDGERRKADLPPIPSVLRASISEPREYGIHLFSWLFRGDVGEAFNEARILAENPSRGFDVYRAARIRLRLWLDPNYPELSQLNWECLYNPDEYEPLCLSIPFSRFIRAKSSRSQLILDRPLRMLLITSNPSNTDSFEFSDIKLDVAPKLLQLDRLETNPTLEKIYNKIVSAQESEPDNHYHIIHLQSHAEIRDEGAYIVLTDDRGRAEEIPYEVIYQRLGHDHYRSPYLVFLATPIREWEQCQKLARLAFRLVDAGVCAVVTTNAPIGKDTLHQFTQQFYDTLLRSGSIDMAISKARSKIYISRDWEYSYPILYTSATDVQMFQPLSEKLEYQLFTVNQSIGNISIGKVTGWNAQKF